MSHADEARRTTVVVQLVERPQKFCTAGSRAALRPSPVSGESAAPPRLEGRQAVPARARGGARTANYESSVRRPGINNNLNKVAQSYGSAVPTRRRQPGLERGTMA